MTGDCFLLSLLKAFLCGTYKKQQPMELAAAGGQAGSESTRPGLVGVRSEQGRVNDPMRAGEVLV
jgi:hypothetical protein